MMMNPGESSTINNIFPTITIPIFAKKSGLRPDQDNKQHIILSVLVDRNITP